MSSVVSRKTFHPWRTQAGGSLPDASRWQGDRICPLWCGLPSLLNRNGRLGSLHHNAPLQSQRANAIALVAVGLEGVQVLRDGGWVYILMA
jgi:hypothetical protein